MNSKKKYFDVRKNDSFSVECLLNRRNEMNVVIIGGYSDDTDVSRCICWYNTVTNEIKVLEDVK